MQLLAELFPLLAYTLVTLVLIGGLMAAARWLGARNSNDNKELPYESGIVPSGSARLAMPVPFYLIAIFFIVFDVESAFIFTWAVAWDRLGLAGLLHITFFIVTLLLGLGWIWLKGGLEWGPTRQDRGARSEEVIGSVINDRGSIKTASYEAQG